MAGPLTRSCVAASRIHCAMSASPRKGRRARVIYYHVSSAAQIRLLLIYAKGRKDDLSADEKRVLRGLNERW